MVGFDGKDEGLNGAENCLQALLYLLSICAVEGQVVRGFGWNVEMLAYHVSNSFRLDLTGFLVELVMLAFVVQ